MRGRHVIVGKCARTTLSAGLAHCVLWAALTQDPPEKVEAMLRQVGADHYRQGFPDDAYLGIGRALLRSARDNLDAGWDSRLSSAWVNYCQWLDAYLRIGSELARTQDGAVAPGVAAGIRTDGASSLDKIFWHLRSTYFAENERGLAAVCTRVMLRTGADLRAPRPDQLHDAAVIAHVNESLLLMGFAPAPLTSGSIRRTGAAGSPGRSAPGDGADPASRQRLRWWSRRRRGDESGPQRQLPTAPGAPAGDRR